MEKKKEKILLNKEALKYNNSASKLKIDIDQITSTITPRWTLYNTERFSTKPKSAYLKKLNVPGPGMYNLQTYMGEGPKYIFPKQKDNHSDEEDESISKKAKGYPSRKTYFKKFSYSPSGPFITISKLKRPEIENDKFLIPSPGPTSYNPNKTFLSTWIIFPTWNWHNPLKVKSSIYYFYFWAK